MTNFSPPHAASGLYVLFSLADGSNNRLSSGGPGNQAVPGYDLTTGLGSFNGANLFADLVAAAGGK